MFSQYVLILVWVGIATIFAKYAHVNKTVLIEGKEETRYYWLFAFIVIIPVIFMAAYRPEEFGDTGSYYWGFMHAPDSIDEVWDFANLREKDRGFYLFEGLVKVFITKDPNIFFMIVAAIQGISLISIYRYYSSDFMFSIFFFIASADYITWMFNGIRQFTAAAIIFACVPWLLKKKYVPMILAIIFASTFHQSALIMIPIIFIVQGEAWNKKTLTVILLAIIAIVFVGRFTGFLDSSLQDTQYKNVVTEYTEFGDNGTNPIRALVYSVPTFLALYGRKKIQESNSKLLNICVNMSIVSSGLYIVSIFTSGIFLGRLPMYCSLFNYILLPWEIKLLFEEDMRKTVNLVAIVLYLAYYVFQVHFTWGLF